MTRILHTALAVATTLGLALAASAAIAHSPGNGGGAQGGMAGSMHGMHGMHAGMHEGMAGSMAGRAGAGQELMTPQERDALREKMADAKTPQERQALAAGMRAEMEKRAKERGIVTPDKGAAHGGMGMQQGSGGGHRH